MKGLARKNIQEIKEIIAKAIPPDSVIARHTDNAHFYEVPNGNTYKSVSAILNILKDKSIQNFQKNETLRFIQANFHKYSESVDGQLVTIHQNRVLELLQGADNAPGNTLTDAGDIGTKIHDRRERYFADWIKFGHRPPSISAYISGDDDPRMHSAMRALDAFCTEYDYLPVATELMVYSDSMRLAGTLDDIGFIGKDLVLLDLKTSNQFKNSYFLQVAFYYYMFRELTGIAPKRLFILKLSKEDGTYKLEEIFNRQKLIRGIKGLVELDMSLETCKVDRKDNQKTVITL